jgi:hypothetical protein
MWKNIYQEIDKVTSVKPVRYMYLYIGNVSDGVYNISDGWGNGVADGLRNIYQEVDKVTSVKSLWGTCICI